MAVYSNSFSGQFIWDDNYLIKENIKIRNWNNIIEIFTANIGAAAGEENNFYRPLQIISYLFDFQLYGLNPAGYHLTNIVLHILVSLCVLLYVRILFKDNLLSFLTASLFVVHPIHTEAVAYVSGRADSLSAMFIFLCLISYAKIYHSSKKNIWFVIMLLSCLLALLSKEISIILPLLILLYHYTFKKQIVFKWFLPLIGIISMFIVLRLFFIEILSNTVETSFIQRLPGVFFALTKYIDLLIRPYDLHMEYGYKLFSFKDTFVVIGIILFIIFLVSIKKIRKKNQLLFFSLGWFILCLLPMSNIFPLNAFMAEHWLYLSSVGFFLIIAKMILFLYRHMKFHYLAGGVFVFIILFYSVLTIKQNQYWKNPITFFTHTIKYAPKSARIYNALGNEYNKIVDIKKAITYFEKAIKIDLRYLPPYKNLSMHFLKIGNYEKASEIAKAAINVNSNDPELYNILGVIYLHSGQKEKSLDLFFKAVQKDEKYAHSYYNIGLMYKSSGDIDKAKKYFKKAIQHNHFFLDAINDLGILYASQNKAKAKGLFMEIISKDPSFAKAYINLSVIYLKEGDHERSLKYYDKAVKLGGEINPYLREIIEKYRKENDI